MAGTPQIELGTVVSLWRYPVTSMMGEELNAADLTERGVLGDRAYALMDSSTGKLASAKNPRKWVKLFDCRAAFVDAPRLGDKTPPARITLPDGTIVATTQSGLDKMLSNTLGHDVTLAATPPPHPSLEEYWPDVQGLAHREAVTDEATLEGTFFDGAVIHLLTTATIDRFRDLYPRGRFEARRFRPNIVLEPASAEKGFAEDGWIGRTIAIGDRVRLSITRACPRCVMTTLAQADLPADPGILRTAAQHNDANVGVYAAVVQSGRIRRGDPVRAEAG